MIGNRIHHGLQSIDMNLPLPIYFIESLITNVITIYVLLKYLERDSAKRNYGYGTPWQTMLIMVLPYVLPIVAFGLVLDVLEYYNIYRDPLAIHWIDLLL